MLLLVRISNRRCQESLGRGPSVTTGHVLAVANGVKVTFRGFFPLLSLRVECLHYFSLFFLSDPKLIAK